MASATPLMSAEAAEEYTQSLGQIFAGSYRQIAWAKQQGVPTALGLTTAEWVEERLGGYVRLGMPDLGVAVAELTADGMSLREIAEVLGIGKSTVQRVLVPDGTPELEEPQVTEPDAEEPVPDGTPAGDEWYTPRWLFDALGLTFAVDVCAPLDRTYSSVPTDRHFTVTDDGLSQPWDGLVWCNPPYSDPAPWARRMIGHGEGLLLTHMPINGVWCNEVWDVCDAIRLFQAMEFVRPDGTRQRPGYWLQLAAFGQTATKALEKLQPFGDAAANKRRVASPMWRRGA
jgi:hypothetical protein